NSAFIKIISNNGYNASNAQNYEVYLRFKTSNATSIDANGFAGDAAYWYSGANAQFTTSGNIKIKANAAGGSATAYDLFVNFGTYTGSGSFYTVETTEGAWVHSGATGQTDPGAGSSTVLVVDRQNNSAGQSVASNSITTETQLVSNNTGTYSPLAGAGWTPGTWQSTGFSVTKTITSGNMVQIAVTARVEGDNYNYYVPSCAYFRLVRGSTVLATTAVYLTAASYVPSNFWYFNSGNLSINYVDTGVSGSQTYTLQYWLPNENASYTEVVQLGERNMHVIELAQ
ncbi:MAG TPA: hypothetical protein PL084_12855, partial [Chitinophagales bacterium]|nr:hypothetical protein [Chitinophagales bacterium]